jgi:ribosome maturation factor RimP
MALNLDQIRAIADRVAISHGLDVVDIESVGNSKERTLRVIIEKNAEERSKLGAQVSQHPEEFALPETLVANGLNSDQLAFVTHEDCEQFSRDFGTVLDVEELVPGADYTLEVSSPGLDRKLYGRKDYERFRGSLVKVQTTEPIQGNRHWQGRIKDLKENAVIVDLAAMKQKGKARKTAAKTMKDLATEIEIELANIAKANLIPEL